MFMSISYALNCDMYRISISEADIGQKFTHNRMLERIDRDKGHICVRSYIHTGQVVKQLSSG